MDHPRPAAVALPDGTRIAGDVVAGDKVVNIGAPAVPPAQLPRVGPHFTGRDGWMAYLDELFEASGQGQGALAIAIHGMPGIGKTALAVNWGHRVIDRFPDGQLYLDLRGYSRRAELTSAEALEALLRGLGTPAELIPADVDAQAARYRSTLAGRRILIVLDNAANSEQVGPLLPASPGCVALITSRTLLSGLIARHGLETIDLDVLPEDAAIELLTAVIGAERTAREAEATAELARRCAYLPLALRIAAAGLVVHRHDTIAGVVRDLEEDRLSALTLDEGPGETALRTAFDLSYRNLTPDLKRAFPLLGLVEGADVGEHAAAALLDVSTGLAHQLLRRLAGANLIEQVSADRYRTHDLLGDYARELLRENGFGAERQAAARRLLTWLLTAAQHHSRPLRRHRRVTYDDGGATAPLGSQDMQDALDWFNLERAALVAASRRATEIGGLATAWHLADATFDFLDLCTYPRDNLEMHRRGYQAAKLARDRPAQAIMLQHLAIVHRELGRYQDSLRLAGEAHTVFVELRDQRGEAEGLATMGNVYWHLGRFAEGSPLLERALAVMRRIGDRGGEADCLNDLSCTYRRLKRSGLAIALALEALDIHQELGDLRGEALVLNNIALIHSRMGAHDLGLACAERALRICSELRDPSGQAEAMDGLANLRRHVGDTAGALVLAHASLEIWQRIGDARGEAIARDDLARIYLALDRVPEALEHARRALEIDRGLDEAYGIATKLQTLGMVATRTGDLAWAQACFREARERRHAIGDAGGEATALLSLANLAMTEGRLEDALSLALESLELERRCGDPYPLGNRLRDVAAIVERVRGKDAARGYRAEAARVLTDRA